MHEISNADDFKTHVLQAKGWVLVDFWSPTCGPCFMLNDVLTELAQDLPEDTKIVKVNVDEHVEIADAYRVIIMPTVKIFKDGEAVKDVLGVNTPDEWQQMLLNLRKEN